VKGHFFVFNKQEDINEVIEENCVFAIVRLVDDFSFALTVESSETGEQLIHTKIHEKTQASLSAEKGAIMWIHDTFKSEDEDLEAYLFYLVNQKENAITELSNIISKCICETKNHIPYEEYVKADDMDWMADAYIEDARNDDQSEYNEDEDVDMYEGYEEESYYPDLDQEYDNSELVQAHTYERAFVARGDGFGVYGTDTSGDVQFFGDLKIVKDYNGAPVRNLLLHENENKLLFIDPNEADMIKCFDFEKEKVVEEWEATGVKEFKSFYGETKNAQSTPSSNIIACSNKGMYTLDPRVNKSDKAVNQKVYSTNYLFNRISANLNGQIAIGSKNGEIRMYSKMGQNAKTMLPGMGEEITGLDISKDGSWILATTPKYILLIPTKLKDGKNGFEKRMGKEKQKPRKLKIANSDIVKHCLQDKSFTKATFNNGGNITESFITASIGNYIIIWKLKKVSKGNLGDYDIKKLNSSVIASESKFNTDNEILVAMPKAITMERRKIRNH
jgi:hypothetical protein